MLARPKPLLTRPLAEVTKQEQDENKKHADAEAGFITFVVSSLSAALGLVSRCRIPVAAVAQRGLFRILLGSGISPTVVSNVQQKYDDQPWNVNPVFNDDSYIPRFSNPPEERNPIYQGVYPEY